MSDCRCGDELLHCHGTLVRHVVGEVECTESGCAGEIVMHDVVLLCCDVAGAGCCTDDVVLAVPA